MNSATQRSPPRVNKVPCDSPPSSARIGIGSIRTPSGSLSNDHKHGLSEAAFNPYEKIGGSVGTIGEINLDSGVLNPDLMRQYGGEASEAWERASLRTRCDTAIAHEYEEGNGRTHDEAIARAPDTELPISDKARELARKIRDGLTR